MPVPSLDRIIDTIGAVIGTVARGGTTDDTRLALTGTGTAGETVQVFDGDTLLGDVEVGGNGRWLFHTGWLENREYDFRVGYAGAAEASEGYRVTVEAPWPLAPQTAAYPGASVGSVAHYAAFAAVKKNGTVVTWGYGAYGGDSGPVADELVDVVQVFSTESAFAALRADGSVVTWGSGAYGGDSGPVADDLFDVVQVSSTQTAFAALRADGSVVSWGSGIDGGSTVVAADPARVVQVFSSQYAFAALKSDGSVVTWGDANSGGNSSGVTAWTAASCRGSPPRMRLLRCGRTARW